MSHHTARYSFYKLQQRLNRSPQGAPPSETLYGILNLLFTPREAELVSLLPLKPFTVEEAAVKWKISPSEARKVLDSLAERCILLDMDHDGVMRYVLPPPMAGFFEFSLMRTRGDIDQKLLSELFYQYLNVEEDFVKELFFSTETRLGRVFVQEGVLSNENAVHILDYERASHVIRSSSHVAIGMCYCRHKMQHLAKACDAPMDICMTFGSTAASLIRHEYARRVDTAEGLDLLQKAYESNLVQCGENVRNEVSFICNCCGCCCEALLAARKFTMLQPVHTTNFMPQCDEKTCIGCGKCAWVCPIEAITMQAPEDGKGISLPIIDEQRCLGCGVCVRSCPFTSLSLRQRKERVITPVNSVHRLVLMAIEKGKLQDLIFDNQALGSHRAMAAILATILKLPPLQRMMSSHQMKSVYLDKLLSRVNI